LRPVGAQLHEGSVDRLVDDSPLLGIARTKFGLSPVPVRFEILDPRPGAGDVPGADDRKRVSGDGAEGRKVAKGRTLVCRVLR